jgi:hypothetical protein
MARSRKHITLSDDVLARLEHEAISFRVSVSEVVEKHLQADWNRAETSSVLEVKVEQLARDVGELRARVLPLVARVNALLQQVEQEAGGQPSTAPTPAVKIATYEDIYTEGSTTQGEPSGGKVSGSGSSIVRRSWGR